MKTILALSSAVLIILSISFFLKSEQDQVYSEFLRANPEKKETKEASYPPPETNEYEEAKKREIRDFEIALKELKNSKIELVEYEHDHLQCIIRWQKYKSIREMEKGLEELLAEGMKNISKQAELTTPDAVRPAS